MNILRRLLRFVRRQRWRLSIGTLILFGTLIWLGTTQSGWQLMARLLTPLSGGHLTLQHPAGRFFDKPQAAQVHWQDEDISITLHGITLDWSPRALWHGELHLLAANIEHAQIHLVESDKPSVMPEHLALPLTLQIDQLNIARLDVDNAVTATAVKASLRGDAEQYTLSSFSALWGKLNLEAHGKLATAAPFAVDAQSTLTGHIEAAPFALLLEAAGSLAQTRLALRNTAGPFAVQASADLSTFAAQKINAFNVSGNNIDLALLQPGLPSTRLTLNCALDKQSTQSAHCSASNAIPGPWDQGRLPLQQIRAKLSQRADEIRIDDLNIALTRGLLSGTAAWTPAGPSARLNVKGLDASALLKRARATKLDGTLVLAQSGNREILTALLQDSQYSIDTELEHQNNDVKITRMVLQSAPAKLTLQGALQLSQRSFSGNGEFVHFDPARFLRGSSSDINGAFKFSGQWQKAPQLLFDFALHDSRIAAVPATGAGHFELQWPLIRNSNIRLDFGQNHLQLQGAMGQAGEQLQLTIAAPALAAFGVDGDLNGQFQLSGTLDAPVLRGNLRSEKLSLKNRMAWRKLQTDVDIGMAPAAPFNIQLSLGKLELPGDPYAIQQLNFKTEGKASQHTISLLGQFKNRIQASLGARGGFVEGDKTDWRGTLAALTARPLAADTTHSLTLNKEVEVALGADYWRLGKMTFSTTSGEIYFSAAAEKSTMEAELLMASEQFGQLKARAAASNTPAWSLSDEAAVQGELNAAIKDLGQLDPLFADNWKLSGGLDAQLQFKGTTRSPALNGTLSGRQLGLQRTESGLHIRNGELQAQLRDGRLSLDNFSAESVLTAPPKTLRNRAPQLMDEIVATPGRIKASGYMALQMDAQGEGLTEEAQLHFELDRLGISQMPKQWLTLSGRGDLTWLQGALGIRADLNVDAAHWQLADLNTPRLADDVVIKQKVQSASGATAPSQPLRWGGLVNIDLGSYFSFQGVGATGRLDGKLKISATPPDLPRASGTVYMRDGRFNAYGQELSIERGIVNFQGLLENPALNILAVRKGLAVEAGVEITGFAQSPVVRLVSNPDVPDTEKLSWLVLGHEPQPNGTDSGILLAAAGAIFGSSTGGTNEQLKQTFRLSELGVRSGNVGDSGQNLGSRVVGNQNRYSTGSGQVFAVGTQLSKDLKLSYEQALGGTETLLKLTLKLNQHLSLSTSAGTNSAVDLFYTFAFGK